MMINVIIAKIILLLLVNTLIANFVWRDTVHKYQERTGLTSERYPSGIAGHEAEQAREPGPLWLYIIVTNMAMFVVFAVYEAIGHGLGAVLTGLFEGKSSVTPSSPG